MLNGLNIIELHRYTHRCSTLPKGLVDSFPNTQTAVKGLKVIQQDQARFKKFFPFRSHHERPFGPVDELGAQFFLQLAHSLARRRLRDAVGSSSQRETAGPDNVAIKV